MKLYLAIILSVLALSSGHLTWSHENDHEYTFSDYEVQFSKKYADEQEHEIRKFIYYKNVEQIRKINKDSTMTWKAGINHLTDRTNVEINALKGYNRPLRFATRKMTFPTEKTDEIVDLPDSVDWRTKGVVNAVRNQGQCGSCWAFSVVAVMESHIAIQTGKLLEMSEQQLVDCVPNPQHCGGTGGCQGATQELGFDYYHKTGGANAGSAYKYTARDGTCKDSASPKIATIEGFNQLPVNDYDALMTALATKGPVSVSVAADRWMFYDSGIFNGECGATIDHAVVAVGYGADAKGNLFWIIRNSWGNRWGESGHIRLSREKSAKDVRCEIDTNPGAGSGCEGGPSQIKVCGQCGVLSDSSIPFGGKLV